MFIGRKDELAFLREQYNASDGRLLVLYGRRRIGKTELLREFCKDKENVFYTCIECTDREQLNLFSKQMFASGLDAARYLTTFNDWEQAFSSISTIPFKGKKLVVIDEFSHMAKGNTSIMSILKKHWDETLKHQNVMIVLCGSSMGFFEQDLLAQKNPLYGRATGILKMLPMTFYDAIQFFPQYSVFDKIAAFAILGGIPHYLKQFDEQRTLAVNVQKSILQRGSILYSEPEFLLHQSLRETSVYNTIIQAVALGNTRLNGIFDKTQIEKTKLSSYLSNLMELGIIEREFSFSDGIGQEANVQRGLYKVSDNFFRFWYAFVFPYMSELERGDAAGIYEQVIAPKLNQFSSYVFEDICKEYLRKLNRGGTLPCYFTKIGRWWDKERELDIVASDADGHCLICGECKYQGSPFDTHDAFTAVNAYSPKKEDARITYYFFAKMGFTREMVSLAKENGYNLISAEDLLRA